MSKKKRTNKKISGFGVLKKELKSKSKQQLINNEIRENEAMLYLHNGNINEAEEIYLELIERESKSHIAYGNLAVIYIMKGNKEREQIIYLLKKALQIKPEFPDALNNLGVALKEKGDFNSAIPCFQKAIKLKPDYAEAHTNLGNILLVQRELNSAIPYFQKAIKLKPDYAEAHYNLGVTLQEKGDLNSAIKSYQKAINLNPEYQNAYYNLGVALDEKGDLYSAIPCFQKAIKLNPDYAEAHHNLAHAIFLIGDDYQKAWSHYEYRFKLAKKPFITHANPPIPKWQGENLKSNEQLLVVTEQGFGDTIQFMRYIPYLRQQGINVSFCAQTKLHDLIKASNIISKPLTIEEANEVKEGKWISLLSVPQFLNIAPDNPVINDPYIHSSIELNLKWKDLLNTEKKNIIGINWQGNPNAEIGGLRGRSFPLEIFSPIAENNDCKFLSLQKGFGSEQLETCSFKDQFVDCQDQVIKTWGFLETAAMIANCDLVITSDTSIAHLAAGMGKLTWCLLHYSPDWRWGLNGEKTFWYPTIKLFRQRQRNNWAEVIDKVAIELKLLFQSK